MKINWISLSGAFRISHYIVKTSDNRTFNVGADGKTNIDIGDFVREDIEYSATVTGVDIAGNIGEESDPVFFKLDSEYLLLIYFPENILLLIFCIQKLLLVHIKQDIKLLFYFDQSHLIILGLLLSDLFCMMLTFMQ